jgi:putative transcriptional regulator
MAPRTARGSREDFIEFGRRLKDRARNLGVSQVKLAERCGVSRQTVNTVFNGGVTSLDVAYSLAKELGMTLDGLGQGLFYKED